MSRADAPNPDAPNPDSMLDQRLAEVDAAQLRALVGTLLRSAPLGIVVLDSELRFLFVNAALAEMNGVPPADHVGRTIAEVVPDVAADAVAAFGRVLETGTPVIDLELEGETPAQPGVLRSWRESVYRVRLGDGTLGVAAIVVETTEQRRTERRTRRVIDALVGFVGLMDLEGTVLEANEDALAASGMRPDDVIGHRMWDTYWWNHPDSHPEQLQDGIRRAAAGELVRFDARVRFEDRLITLDLQLTPLVEEGAVTAVVASGADVTQRRSATRRLRALGDYSHTLALADTSAAVVEAVLRHVPAALDADVVTLALLDRSERALTVVGSRAVPAEAQERHDDLSLDSRAPLTDAVRDGDIVLVENDDELARRYPHLVDDARRRGVVAVAAAPLVMEGEHFGAISFGWRRALHDEDAMDSRLLVVAELTAQTLQRTRTSDARAQLVSELYQHLVPEPPARPDLEIAVRYQAAGRSIGFGGDWFDVIPLDGDTTAVVVGDVAGHGIPAAARMAVLRTALSTVIRTGTPLADVFDTTEPLVEHLDTAFLGSAVAMVVDPARGTLRYTSAGHPPPLVRPPGEPSRTLEGATRPVLGAGRRRAAAAEEPVPPGTIVVAYTDGLVEGRREHLDVALDRLRAELDAAPASLGCEELADRLLATAGASDELTDDVVLVVLRVDGGSDRGTTISSARRPVRAAYPPVVDTVPAARRWAAQQAREWGADAVVDAIELVVDELVANAVLHAGTDLEVTLLLDDASIRGSVRDHAPGEVRPSAADPDRVGGWGLHLVNGLTSDWHVTHDDHGKTVHFTIPLERPEG